MLHKPAARLRFGETGAFELDAQSPERLVGVGFRSWLAGYQTGDIACWEVAWTCYDKWLGSKAAKTAVSELACWVRAVNEASQRDITIFPSGCAMFCADECLAISLIAAGQQGACPAMQACALALIGCAATDEVVKSSRCFAAVLADLDQKLSPPIFTRPPSLLHDGATPLRH